MDESSAGPAGPARSSGGSEWPGWLGTAPPAGPAQQSGGAGAAQQSGGAGPGQRPGLYPGPVIGRVIGPAILAGTAVTGPPRRPRRAVRASTIILLLAVGLCGVGAGSFALVQELARAPTKAELSAASQAEIALRWRLFPAGKIFPATISYPMPIGAARGTARLVGIAPQATCSAASAPAVGPVLASHHCMALLRATYTDQSGTLLTTIGVAIMPDGSSASATGTQIGLVTRPIHPVGFPGTVSAGFSDSSVRFANLHADGPYVVIEVSGYADHRAAATIDPALSAPADPLYFADDLASYVLGVLTSNIQPCKAVDVRC